MTQQGQPMVLETANDAIKVSGFSSLLRSLQAAVRDAVGRPLLLDDYNQRLGPFLVTSVVSTSESSITLQFWFAGNDNQPLWDTTHTAFESFFREFEATLQRGNQRTFWGIPAYAMTVEDDDNRMNRFIANLRTFGTATLTYDKRVVKLRNGAISLSVNRPHASD